MRIKIEIDVLLPVEYKEYNLPFLKRVMQAFRETYPLAETIYEPEHIPPITVSFWNDDDTPTKSEMKGE